MTALHSESRAALHHGLAAAGEGYQYLATALPYLAEHPDDDHARLMVSREFLRLGLLRPARSLLEQIDREVRANPEIADILRQLPAGASTDLWVRRKARFETNLAALQGHPGIADLIRCEWAAVKDRYELHTDVKKVDQVLFCGDNGRSAWLPNLDDHPRLAESAPPPPDHQELMPGPYLFEGVGLGWFFARLWRTTRDTFLGYSPALYVVEPNPAAFAVALHLHDWSELLADERVLLFLGADSYEAFRDSVVADDDLPCPRYLFKLGLHGPAVPGVEKTLEEIVRVRGVRAQDDFTVLQRRYRDRDGCYWARRFAEALDGSGPPLRILATVSTHTTFLQYSMRDAARAIRQSGHSIEVMTETRPFTTVGLGTYHRRIREFDPDLFFAIDHLRSSFVGALPDGLPLLTWDQDGLRHIFTKENVVRMSPLDTVVGLPHVECTARFGGDRRQFLVAHMATCPEEFDGAALTDADLAPYRCDVSYVSHGSQTPEDFHRTERESMADGPGRLLLDKLFELARERIAASHPIRGHTLRGILFDAERATGVHVQDAATREHLVSWYLWRLCDRMFRHQSLEWAGRWAQARGRALHIYGNGWKKHPTLAPFAAGPAQNGRELLCIYRASTINLQLMPAGFLHQRALDGLAAGGFFLTRTTPADRRDRMIGLLLDAVRRHAVRTVDHLASCGDESFLRGFAEFRESHGFREEDSDLALHTLLNEANWDYPAEVFENFDEIAFHDAASFEKAADRFIDDAALRRNRADTMRKAVLDRYSYAATMRRFLSFVSDYMKQK